MRTPVLLLACLAGPIALLSSTSGSEGEGVAFFEKEIRPLLARRCYSCHSEKAELLRADLRLDRPSSWSSHESAVPLVVPGEPDESLLIRAVRRERPELEMPPREPLPAGEVKLLEHWVRIGAPRPESPTGNSGTPPVDPSDPEAGRDHWAFRPLVDVPPRSAPPPGESVDPIDLYLEDRLEDAGLEPAPPASRRVLLRRLHLALVGLLPTADELRSFLEDPRPDALERRVDQLLASPHFGERWGRHWLDLARYADSNGLDENFLFRQAWRYRNRVIETFNEDQPFDRFVLEQIAGDLLPHETIEQRDRQRIASGFLLLGPKVLLGSHPERQRMDVADEQLDTIGRTVLGQTLGCARCHDHKFDPVPTADYYAMTGILTSTEVLEQRFMLGQQRVMERLVGLGEDGDRLDAEYEKYWRERPALQGRLDRARQALTHLEKEASTELEALVKKHADALAEGARSPETPLGERVAAQKAHVQVLEQKFSRPPPRPARAMIPSDRAKPGDEKIRLAGQYDRRGEVVPRGFLTVLSSGEIEIPADRSGRVELARWLTDTRDGAGVLAARVLANRIWHHLMGRGLVRTVDNFGRTGEPPSHPELLDHLAAELLRGEWSIKSLVRRIVRTRAFARQSSPVPGAREIDPENVLLHRAHRRRLDPEIFRDCLLQVAGQLDPSPRDSTVDYLGDQATAVGQNKNRRRTDFPCRSVYLPVIRNDLPEIFEALDFTDPQVTTGLRPRTVVATQGLFLLNDPSVTAAARGIATRLLEEHGTASRPDLIDAMFLRILQVSPTASERRNVESFLVDLEADPDLDRLERWTLACQALAISSRFLIPE